MTCVLFINMDIGQCVILQRWISLMCDFLICIFNYTYLSVFIKTILFYLSGQVRMFNMLIQSKPLPVPVWDRKERGEGVRGDRLHWRVQGSTSSPTGIGSRRGWFDVLWNLECPIELSQKWNVCAFQWRKFGAIWTVRRKINNCGAT